MSQLQSRTIHPGLLALFLLAGASSMKAVPLPVYDDQLRSGFSDWSWAVGNLAQTAVVHSGTAATSFEPDVWEALFLHRDAGIDTAQYEALEFWIHGGPAGGQRLAIAFAVEGDPIGEASLSGFIPGGTVPAGQWTKVRVPFASLGVTSGAFNGFWLQDDTGGNQATVYVDDIQLAEKTTQTSTGLGTFLDQLGSYDSSRWYKSDGWTNGDIFYCGWRADHIGFANDTMTLTLDNTPCPGGCSGKPYASGEYQSLSSYGYGKFETRMKAAKGSGVVSAFFIYNGNPWHEIDVEILGKNTWQLQTNYFTDGVGGHEAVIDLGFDASEAFHNYAIVWEPGSIKWYVDDVLVHQETGGRGPLPTAPGKIMANLWPGTGVDSWLGPFSYTGPRYAQYEWIQYFEP